MNDFWRALYDDAPMAMKALAGLCLKVPALRRTAEAATYRALRRMAEQHRNGTAYWARHHNDGRISAFYKDYATYESIPPWGIDMPQLDPEPDCRRLDHGYDESRAVLGLEDLRGAAAFRGGSCLSGGWDGDMYTPLDWTCAFGHQFTARPYTVLKAGHWCPECAPPPWSYDEEARRNPFFAQVWYPNHDRAESNFYAADCIQDIAAR
jgi:hypothetical protein